MTNIQGFLTLAVSLIRTLLPQDAGEGVIRRTRPVTRPFLPALRVCHAPTINFPGLSPVPVRISYQRRLTAKQALRARRRTV